MPENSVYYPRNILSINKAVRDFKRSNLHMCPKRYKRHRTRWMLSFLLSRKTCEEVGTNNVDANGIVEFLDDVLPMIVKDTNAAALDSALSFAVLYADHCITATSSDQSSKITSNLLLGSGLSASRPSTVKFYKALLLKLMEVDLAKY